MSSPVTSRSSPAGDPLENLTATENPRLHALLHYWRQHLQTNGFVLKSSFNPFDLKPWLGFLTLFEKTTADYIIRIDGTEIVRLVGEDWTGKSLRQAENHFGINLSDSFAVATAENRPVYHAHHHIATKPRLSVGRLILPLSRDGTGISHLMVCLMPNPGSEF